jgi:hypothetical protein
VTSFFFSVVVSEDGFVDGVVEAGVSPFFVPVHAASIEADMADTTNSEVNLVIFTICFPSFHLFSP